MLIKILYWTILPFKYIIVTIVDTFEMFVIFRLHFSLNCLEKYSWKWQIKFLAVLIFKLKYSLSWWLKRVDVWRRQGLAVNINISFSTSGASPVMILGGVILAVTVTSVIRRKREVSITHPLLFYTVYRCLTFKCVLVFHSVLFDSWG